MVSPYDPVNPQTLPALGSGNVQPAPSLSQRMTDSALPANAQPTYLPPVSILPQPSTAVANAANTANVPSVSAPNTVDPNAKMIAQLTAAGYDTPTANALITKYNQTAAKNAALKNLPAGFADIIKQHDADTAAATGPTQQRIMDPLAMQLFFQNTIAPYLDKTSQGIKATAAGMGQTMQGLIPNLPPAYQAVLSQSLPGTQAGMAAMGDAYSGAAVAAPAVQSLQNQLSMAWQAQKLAQYYAEKNIAYNGGANSSGVPTADEIAQITQLLGSGNTGTGQ